jgi:succinate dehydrogenase hydrophobic anchor subunit
MYSCMFVTLNCQHDNMGIQEILVDYNKLHHVYKALGTYMHPY